MCIARAVSCGQHPRRGSYKQWTRGPEDRGPEDPRTGDPRTRGPEDPRTRGPEDPRTRGPEDPRTRGPEDPRTRGPEDPRTRGPEDRGPKDRGPEDPRTRGPEDQGPEDIITEGCFALQQLPIAKIQLYTANLGQCYKPKLTVMSCSSSLKALLLTNNAISNYPLSSLMLRVVYCQSCKAIYLSRRLCM